MVRDLARARWSLVLSLFQVSFLLSALPFCCRLAGLRSVEGPPVGNAVSDDVDVDGQHSRDLGWATNLLGMQFAVCNKRLLPSHSTSHSTKSSSSSGRRMLKTPSHLQIEFGGPPSIMRAASAISEISIFYESGLGYFRNMFHYESGLRSFRNNHPP